MRLRTRLFMLVTGTVIPLAVLAVVLGALFVEHEVEIIRTSALDRTRAVMSAVDAELRGHVALLRALAADDDLRAGKLSAFRQSMARLLPSQPSWENVILSAPDGRQLVSAIVPDGEATPRDADPESVAKAVETQEPAVGRVARRERVGQYGIAVRYPIVENGRVTYVLSAIIDPVQFERLILAQDLSDGWVSGLVDQTAHFVARVPHRSNAESASPAFRAAIANQPDGWYRGLSVEGKDFFTAFRTSRMSGWTIGLGVPAGLIFNSATRAAWLLALGTIATIAVAFGIAFWMSRRITDPIARLAAEARALGREPIAGEGPEIPPIEELADVARALRDARSAIADRETLLQREQSALREADRSKDEFLAMLGHELRNPLSAISASSHVLRAAPAGSDIDQRARTVIERQTRQMARLVDDLLDISRLTMGKVTLSRDTFDLGELARNLVQTWVESGRVTRGQVTLDTQPAWIEADRSRIEQVLANLLDNANKFGPAGNPIHITVRREDHDAIFTIRDEGEGIAPELLGDVFKLFVQAPQGPDREGGGLGLGLALVRRLLDMHGGSVSVASPGLGKGATFTVRLPAAPVQSGDPSKPRFWRGARRSLRVLTIEDNADSRDMTRTMLELSGHEVRAAADGAQGLEEAARWRPDVVLLDIGLPGMDGYEIAKRIKANPALARTRIIALTGYGLAEDAKRAFAAGFDLHLTKPVDPEVLEEALAASSQPQAS